MSIWDTMHASAFISSLLSPQRHVEWQLKMPQVSGDAERELGTHRETVRLVRRLHQFDVMRANKAPFAFGLEPRVPFLDKAFLDTSMTMDPADKMVPAPPLPSR